MRAAGPEKGARRHYRQLLRAMLREGDVLLDKKGRLSIPKPEVLLVGAHPFDRKTRTAGRGAARSHRAPPDALADRSDRHTSGLARASTIGSGAQERSGSNDPIDRPKGRAAHRHALARFDGPARGFG